MICLTEEIKNSADLSCGFVYRDGFVFTAIDEPANVYDALVIHESDKSTCMTPRLPFSSHSLSEHITLIQQHGIKKAFVIAENINWIQSCPSLEAVDVCPSDAAEQGFDFSPLKCLPDLKWVRCRTQYGSDELIRSVVYYSDFPDLQVLSVDGKGHFSYEAIQSLITLSISRDREHLSLENFSCGNLKDLTLVQCAFKSLQGVRNLPKLQSLDLAYLRSLNDLSDLRNVSDSLRLLSIEACPKITDFSWLESLTHLEHLILLGNNKLPDLSFLKKMDKLKTLVFSMNIENGDLLPCLSIPYVFCSNWHKHYNMKKSDLPHNQITDRFEIK